MLDRCVVVESCAPGSPKVGKFGIVAPDPTIFLSDTVTLNLADTRVVALQAAIEAMVGVGPTGVPVTGFTRGYRSNVKSGNLSP